MINSKVILNIIKDPEDTCQGDLWAGMGKANTVRM